MTILYILMILLGFTPFAITMYKMAQIKRMRKEGIRTTAVVKEIYSRSSRGANRILIEFNLENGQPVSQEIIVADSAYNEGDTLPLIYEKDDPAKNILDPGNSYIAIIVFTLLVALFMIFACYKIKKGIETGNFE